MTIIVIKFARIEILKENFMKNKADSKCQEEIKPPLKRALLTFYCYKFYYFCPPLAGGPKSLISRRGSNEKLTNS